MPVILIRFYTPPGDTVFVNPTAVTAVTPDDREGVTRIHLPGLTLDVNGDVSEIAARFDGRSTSKERP